jgi:hypothetical protein
MFGVEHDEVEAREAENLDERVVGGKHCMPRGTAFASIMRRSGLVWGMERFFLSVIHPDPAAGRRR